MYKEEEMRGKKPEENAMRSSRSILPSPRAPSLAGLFDFFIVIFFLFLSYSFSSSSSCSSYLSFSSSLHPVSLSYDRRRERSLRSVLSLLFSQLSPACSPAANLASFSTLLNTSVHWRQTSAPAQKIRDKLIDTRRTRTLYIPTILVECKTSLKAGAKKRRRSSPQSAYVFAPLRKGLCSHVLVMHLMSNVNV